MKKPGQAVKAETAVWHAKALEAKVKRLEKRATEMEGRVQSLEDDAEDKLSKVDSALAKVDAKSYAEGINDLARRIEKLEKLLPQGTIAEMNRRQELAGLRNRVELTVDAGSALAKRFASLEERLQEMEIRSCSLPGKALPAGATPVQLPVHAGYYDAYFPARDGWAAELIEVIHSRGQNLFHRPGDTCFFELSSASGGFSKYKYLVKRSA